MRGLEQGHTWVFVGDTELPRRTSCDRLGAVEGFRCDAKPVGCLRALGDLHMEAELETDSRCIAACRWENSKGKELLVPDIF